MENKEEFLQEQTDLFTENLRSALEIASSPEDVKWAIFSTGTRELEEAVLDNLVNAFLKNVEGVFIFRPENPEHCRTLLRGALSELDKKFFKTSLAKSDEFVLKTGV